MNFYSYFAIVVKGFLPKSFEIQSNIKLLFLLHLVLKILNSFLGEFRAKHVDLFFSSSVLNSLNCVRSKVTALFGFKFSFKFTFWYIFASLVHNFVIDVAVINFKFMWSSYICQLNQITLLPLYIPSHYFTAINFHSLYCIFVNHFFFSVMQPHKFI